MLRLLQISHFTQIKVQSMKKKEQDKNKTPPQNRNLICWIWRLKTLPLWKTHVREWRRQTGENVCKTRDKWPTRPQSKYTRMLKTEQQDGQKNNWKTGQKIWTDASKIAQMANKCMKWRSTARVIRELPIKAPRCHHTPIRMPRIPKNRHRQSLVRMRSHRTLTHRWECKDGRSTLDDRLIVSYKADIILPYTPTIAPLSVYPTDLKTHIQQKLTQVLALFIITPNRKQPRCLSLGKAINWGRSIQWIQQ